VIGRFGDWEILGIWGLGDFGDLGIWGFGDWGFGNCRICRSVGAVCLLEQSRIDRVLTGLDNDHAFGVPVSGVQQHIECLGNDC
jgi:hypothetical protein